MKLKKKLLFIFQGVWFGLFISIGSLGRMVGPLYMNPVYNNWGLYALACVIEAAMFASLILLLAVYKELVPLEVIIARKKKKGGSKVA